MLTFVVTEQTTPLLQASLIDSTDAAVSVISLNSILLTLYDEATAVVINGRNHESVLGGDVTVDTDGLLSWTLEEEDTPILTVGVAEESHIALFEIAWTAGGKDLAMRLPIRMIVQNLTKIPAVL